MSEVGAGGERVIMGHMDHNYLVKSMASAATDVCGTMLGVKIVADKAYIEQTTPTESERVVALIGFAGTWIGTGMISCSSALACRISSLLLLSEYEAVTEDVLDAMAEMANMIYGGVKTGLEDELGSLGLSIPTVIFGRNFAARSIGKQSWTVVPIQIGGDVMELKMCLSESHGPPNTSRTPMRPYAVLREEA